MIFNRNITIIKIQTYEISRNKEDFKRKIDYRI